MTQPLRPSIFGFVVLISPLSAPIPIDGGVALDTVAEIVRAGTEILVAGNAVFGQGDPKTNAEKLLKAAGEATLQKA
jgi:ribulose-phosphate 3-epimerase